jgi:hypothetical protein
MPRGPLELFFPNPEGKPSLGVSCYDVELGANLLVAQGVLPPDDPAVEEMVQHLEDVQFLGLGFFKPPEYCAEDPYGRGGFSKVQPYYTRTAETYALRDEVRPFLRAYFNTAAAMVDADYLQLWENPWGCSVWNKTHETGYFLHHTRTLFLTERGEDLWLAPFVPSHWLDDGEEVAVAQAPTAFGPVGYRIRSLSAHGIIEAEIDPPTRNAPKHIVIRFRHPQGKRMRSVWLGTALHPHFDAERECIRIVPSGRARVTVRAI